MRLIETVRFPSETRWGGISFNFNTGGIYGGISVGGGLPTFVPGPPYGRFPQVFFAQPRLGRKTTVERIAVNNLSVFNEGNAGPTNNVAFNYQMYLNGLPVSETRSLVYTVENSPVPVLGTIPLMDQNGPITIEPYTPLTVYSSDQLAIQVTTGVEIPIPGPTNAYILSIGILTVFQILGENEAT